MCSMNYPLTKQELLERVARETARMSYPGSMSRGSTQVVMAGTKKKVEDYFAVRFPLYEVWDNASRIADQYDAWHEQRTKEIGRFLKRQKCLGNPNNNEFAIGSKFLNTFMHQLMKYEWARPLWQQLHLPLDARVFQAFSRTKGLAMAKINSCIGTNTAYSISYEDYQFIQNALWEFMAELNERPNVEFQVKSRIELNYLWL
jgi:hypothetical protein